MREAGKKSPSGCLQVAVVALGVVEDGGGIVACHPVFGDQGGGDAFGVFIKEAVMAYAQAHDDV